MENTAGFYKYDTESEQWFYAPNFVYSKDYELHRDGNKEVTDGWAWYDEAPEEFLKWEMAQTDLSTLQN